MPHFGAKAVVGVAIVGVAAAIASETSRLVALDKAAAADAAKVALAEEDSSLESVLTSSPSLLIALEQAE